MNGSRATTRRARRGGWRRIGRLGLWLAPLALVACLLTWIDATEISTEWTSIEACLLAGDGRGAHRLANRLEEHSPEDPALTVVRHLADVLEDRPAPSETTGVGPAPAPSEGLRQAAQKLPLSLMIRRAFERGEFDTSLRLTEIARELGLPTVPALTTAAKIELGEGISLASYGSAVSKATHRPQGASSRLLARLDDVRRGLVATDTLLLRDREGLPLGQVDSEGILTVADGLNPALVPHALGELRRPEEGLGSLRLSLDLELAEAAYAAFGRWYRGTIVLVDPASGEILAAVSDRRTHRQGRTPAFEEYREPASISKLITTTAALRAGFDPDAEIGAMRCRGHERYSGELLYCPHIAGPLRGLDRALGISCNVAFASLGVSVGRDGLLDELRRYGFGRPLGSFAGGRIVQGWGDDRQLADLSIGLDDTELTPLHGALIAAVMANDGVMPEPTLIRAEDGRLGLHPRPVPRGAGRQVLDPAWLPEILDAMEVVSSRGTGRGMAPRSFPVAMKTGTASHPQHGFHVNYIGIGPMPDARVAWSVRITHQPTSRKVRTAAREVTRRLLRNLDRIAERRGWHDHPVDSTPWPDTVHTARYPAEEVPVEPAVAR